MLSILLNKFVVDQHEQTLGCLLAFDCLSKRGTFPYRKSEDFFLSKDKPRIFTIFIAFKPTPLGFLTHQRSCIWFSCFSTFTRKTPVKPWQPSMRFTRPKFARASLFSASDFWFISRTFKSLPRSGKTLAQNLDNIGFLLTSERRNWGELPVLVASNHCQTSNSQSFGTVSLCQDQSAVLRFAVCHCFLTFSEIFTEWWLLLVLQLLHLRRIQLLASKIQKEQRDQEPSPWIDCHLVQRPPTTTSKKKLTTAYKS